MIREPQHPSWWKELKALYRDSAGDLSNAQALQLAQVAGHGLPAACCQEEASGWWEAPHSLHGLCHQDFLPHVDFPSMRDFWVTRQEETLALAQALQHCAERSRMPSRVLCDAAWDLQRCMVPLMHLEGDEIVEALLLGPTDDGPRTSPTLAEEAVLLGDEPEPQEATTFPCEHLEETPKPEEPVEWSDAPCLPAPSAIASGSSSNQSRDTRRAQCRARPRHLATPDPLDNPNDWVLTYLAERDELPNWWPEFWSLHHRDARPLSEAQVQELAQKQAMAFRLPTAQREKSGWWNTPPSLASLGHVKISSLPHLPDPRAPGTSEW